MPDHIKESYIISIISSLAIGISFFFIPFNPWLYLALFVVAVFILSINIESGIYLILFSIPFSQKIEFQGIPISTTDIVFLAFLAALVIDRLFYSKKKFIFKTNLTIPFSLLILFLILSFVRAEGKFAGMRQLFKYGEMYIFFLCIINIVDSKEKLYRLIWFLIAVACIFCVIVIIFISSNQYIATRLLFLSRGEYGPCFTHPNVESAYLGLIMPFAFFIYVTRTKEVIKKVISLTAFLLILLIEFLTFSRGALAGSIVGILASLFLYSRYRFAPSLNYKSISILALIVTLLMTYEYSRPRHIFFPQKVLSVRHLFTDVAGDPGVRTRIKITRLTLKNIKEHPFLGIGAGNFIYLYFGPRYLGKNWMPGLHHVHNLYLQIWMEMGIFVLISYLSIIFLYFRNALTVLKRYKDRLTDPVALASLSAVTGYSLHSMLDFLFIQHVQLLFIFVLAIPFMRIWDKVS